MGEVQKTLLQIDGDASGIKKASAEGISAIQQTAAATSKLGAVSNESASSAEKLGKAVDQAGDSFDKSGRYANTLAEIVSKIDPRLGDLVRTGGKLDEVFAAAFSPAGLMTGGLLAALAAVSAVISSIQQSIEQAKRDLADMEAARARIARDKLEAAGEVGKALAARGAGSEGALERATGLARSLETQGFERSTAVQVAAAGEAGGTSMSDADLRRLAMGVQLGAVDISGGRNAAETQAVLQKALDNLANMPADLQAALESGIEQTMRGKSLGSLREAAQGTQGFLEDALRQRGFEGETLAEKAEKVRAALRGPQSMWDFDEGGGAYQRTQTQEEFAKVQAEGLALVELLRQDVKTKEAQLSGQRERVQRILMSAPPGPPVADPKTWAQSFGGPDTGPDKSVAAEETRRRDRVQSMLSGLQTEFRKSTMSPEDFLRQQLEEMGATPEEISQALSFQSGALAAKQKPQDQTATRHKQSSASRSYNPDAQNQPQVVHQYFTGHVVIGDASQPWKNRQPRSPAR